MDQLQISKTMDVEQMREEEKDNQLEDENQIREDFYYDESELTQRKKESVIKDEVARFKSLYGFDSEKKENFRFVSKNMVVYSSGVSYMLLDLEKGKTQILQSRDGGGVGCIAVHPDNDYIAVAEKGYWPNIYVYDFPDLNLYRILKKGAERSYSNIVFSQDGHTLASVGNSPDYLLSIWDWKKQQIKLKSKAFSQEVYKIQFSFYQPDVLATMGTGHIKFWKIAETFTGLKLKGQIAKFGTQEISDVITCYHFSDGKILSSTEYGNMLLWEGNLIKCVIGLSEEQGVHDGAVEVIFKEEDYIVTAGRDGMIKYWSHSEIDNCEPDDSMNYFPKLQGQVRLGGSIVDIQRFQDRWILHDKLGKLSLMDGFNDKMVKAIKIDNDNQQQQAKLAEEYKQQQEQFKSQMDSQASDLTPEQIQEMNEVQQKLIEQQEQQIKALEQKREYTLQEEDLSTVLKLNNGAIKGNVLSENLMLTLSQDNRIMLTDLAVEQQLACKHMDDQPLTQGTAMAMKPGTQLESAAGFSNGIMRVVVATRQEEEHCLRVKKSYKVFDNAISHLVFSPSGEVLLCVSCKGEIFLLEHYMPYCLFETGHDINSVVFNQMGNKVLLGLKDGRVLEFRVPRLDHSDTSETYLQEMEVQREQKIKMMEFQKPKVEDMDIDFFIKKKNAAPGAEKDPKDEEWDPEPIQQAVYYDQDCRYALAAVGDNYAGHLYVMDFIADRPIHHIAINPVALTYLHLDFKLNILFLGTEEGKVELRHREGPEEHWLQLECHDQDYGKVLNVQFNAAKSHVVSASADGTVRVNAIDYETLSNQFKGMDYVETYRFIEPERTFVKELSHFQEEDTQDKGQYCLQQAKLLLNEDLQRKEAEKKKNAMREQIEALRQDFVKVKAENKSKDKVLQLGEDQMEVDSDFQHMFQQRMEDEVEETRKVLQYDIQYNKVKTQKIRNYMIDELVIDKFAVKVIRNPKIQVKTFKLQKMSQYLQENLELNYKEIEEQQQNERDEHTEKKEEQQENEHEHDKDKYDIDLEELERVYDQELEAKGLKEGAQKRKEKRKMLEERINVAIDELKKEEPTREAFDPDHKKEIAEAYSKFGDYKLKNDKNFVVPENQRMNVGKKRKHLFLLEEFIYNSKLKFNNEVIQLRELKKFITQKVKENNLRIGQINQELDIEETLQEIEIDKDAEYPESKLEIVMENSAQKEEQAREEQEAKAEAKAQRRKEKEISGKIKELVISSNIKNRKAYKVEKSPLEEMNDKIREMKLQAEKKKLKEEMDKLINDFDIEVVKLSNEKNIIEGDLMVAKMKLTTFYQELLILEDMEEKDNNLIEELIKLRKEKQNLEEQTIQLINNLLAIKENEVRIEKTLADLMKQFKELVHQDDDVARNKIHEHYRKQFKQKKAKQIKQLNDDEELNEDEDEEEEEEEGSDQEDDEDKPDTTPIESDPKSKEILESIVQNEDEQETNKKNRQDLEASKKMITNKTNQLLQRLENTENELKDYQRVKLQKLNKIDVSIVLNLHQIQNLFPARGSHLAPDDLNSSILFTQQNLNNLTTRIVQLQQEKNKIQSNKNHLKRKKNHIDKELARLQQDYQKLQKDYEEKHMLKFGYIMDKEKMDLKFLEAFEPSKQLLDMRTKYKKEENASIRKIEEAQNQLIETKKELLQAKKENTGIIQSITDLGKQQISLNKQLDSTNKKLFKQQNEDLKMSNERDKKNLKELINFLNKLIIDLKGEIGIFKRKGGHIYTLVSNNTKQ